jgi:hypothetical protein
MKRKDIFFLPHLTRLVARMEGRDQYDLIPILLFQFLEAKIFINESIGLSVWLDFSLWKLKFNTKYVIKKLLYKSQTIYIEGNKHNK